MNHVGPLASHPAPQRAMKKYFWLAIFCAVLTGVIGAFSLERGEVLLWLIACIGSCAAGASFTFAVAYANEAMRREALLNDGDADAAP